MCLLTCYLCVQDARRIQRHVEQVQRKKRKKRRKNRETTAAAAAAHSQRKHRCTPRQVPVSPPLSFFPYPRCYLKRFCPLICCRNRWLKRRRIRWRMRYLYAMHALPATLPHTTRAFIFPHHTETRRASRIRLSGWRRKRRRRT
jgi:hypothetical protein